MLNCPIFSSTVIASINASMRRMLYRVLRGDGFSPLFLLDHEIATSGTVCRSAGAILNRTAPQSGWRLRRLDQSNSGEGIERADGATVQQATFDVEVADRLRMRGYKVDLQVEVSRKEERPQDFRIDLGVRHPDHPER